MSLIPPQRIRQIILEQSKRAHVGHIGCALSVADILSCLYGRILSIGGPHDPGRDRFVMSKGHAALALYAALHLKGCLTAAQLDTYCGDGSLLGVHPECDLPYVDFSTGSLGQGLSYAAGAALAARMQKSDRRVYALLSDGECNEGATWEAAMFAAQHRLSNLLAVIDFNGQQAFGYTKDVLDLSNMAERWRECRWKVAEVDGHDAGAMEASIRQLQEGAEGPQLLIAHTTFGKGVSFMESRIKWHYWPMSGLEYEEALQQAETAV